MLSLILLLDFDTLHASLASCFPKTNPGEFFFLNSSLQLCNEALLWWGRASALSIFSVLAE